MVVVEPWRKRQSAGTAPSTFGELKRPPAQRLRLAKETASLRPKSQLVQLKNNCVTTLCLLMAAKRKILFEIDHPSKKKRQKSAKSFSESTFPSK
jgi:hypothetical protein